MGKKAFPYFVTCVCTYVIMTLIEIVVLNNLIDIVSTSDMVHMVVYLVLMLTVNPLLTRIITDKIDFSIKNEESSVQ